MLKQNAYGHGPPTGPPPKVPHYASPLDRNSPKKSSSQRHPGNNGHNATFPNLVGEDLSPERISRLLEAGKDIEVILFGFSFDNFKKSI